MAVLIDVPVEGGGRLLVRSADPADAEDLGLAGPSAGEIVTKARKSLQEALDELRPAVEAVRSRFAAMGPDEFTVDFGLTFSATSGVIVASGSAEVSFSVSLTWQNEAKSGGDGVTG